MLRRGLVLCAVLGFATVAQAGAVIGLVPDNPGPYSGGETVNVDVFVTTDQDLDFRLLGFDTSQTDPAIGLPASFNFDLSSLVSPALYSSFPNLPNAQVVYGSTSLVPGFILHATSGVEFHAGSIEITLPTEVGEYMLDLANFAAIDTNQGARIDFDFTNRVTWSTLDDGNVEISGGQHLFIVPEPATLVLLGLGGVAAAMRRRMA